LGARGCRSSWDTSATLEGRRAPRTRLPSRGLREQLIAQTLRSVGLTTAEVEAMTPLAVMRLVMAARMKAGDHAGALVAAEAAAP
jgi:hypothetical protein